jgi:hypothetical protein
MQAKLNENVVLVQIRATKWSGTRQVPKNDPNLRVDDPPPEKVWRSWGSKAVFDQDELRIFDAIEKDADRSALSVGTRFLLPRQYVVHAEQAPGLERKLQDCKRRHEAARDDLVSRYDDILEAFIIANRQWEAFIRASSMQPEHVATRFRFEYLVIPVEGGATRVIEEQMPVLAAGILGEVETIGRDLIRNLTGRDTMTRRGLGPFKRIRDKLDALSFVDQRFQPIIDAIDEWVARIPRNGPIDGHLFSEAYGLALLLGDAQRMASHGAGQLAARTAPPMSDEDEAPEPEDDQAKEDVSSDAAAALREEPAEEAGDDIDDELDAIFGPASDEDEAPEPSEDEDAAEAIPTAAPAEPAPVHDDGWF